jgi:uncharacterized RmlC-like cupin family protein
MLCDCRWIEFPRITDARGNLTFVEKEVGLPFDIERVYFLYDVPGGESRGAHGHRELQQIILALSGSFDITLDDGVERSTFHLNRPYKGLYIPPMTWRDLGNFSSGSVCLVLASQKYDASDYFRDYEVFLAEAID